MDGKIDKLTIKADRSGIVIYIPQSMTLNDICFELYRKITDNVRAFQKTGTIHVSFNGQELSDFQAEKIVDFLNSIDVVHVSFVLGSKIKEKKSDGSVTDVTCFDHLPASQIPGKYSHISTVISEKPYVFRGNINKKQTLEIKGNVIIIGDVARDATVVSGKSIIVIGSLLGNAIAGREEQKRSYIMAMRMSPQKLQIGKAGCRYPQIKDYLKLPMIATNEYNLINITYL